MRPTRLATLTWITFALAVAPSEAFATVPCDPDQPCHNNPAEFPVMAAFAAEGYGLGLIATIGNAVALARGSRPNSGWLGVGYFAVVHNFAFGGTWTGLGASSLARFPDDPYAKLQLGIGLAHLGVGSITLGVTLAAQARWRPIGQPAKGAVVVPTFIPTERGGAVGVAGAF